MTTSASRKSSRAQKTPLDLTNPRSKLAKCSDIKALVKEKVGKLSKDAQKELMLLLPACDQQYDDLTSALEANPTFWSSLEEWHELLQAGDLRPSKKNLNNRDLKAIPWKDDNYERFWGERIIADKKSKQKQPSSARAKKEPKKKQAAGTKVERRGRKKKVTETPPEEEVVKTPSLENADTHEDTTTTKDDDEIVETKPADTNETPTTVDTKPVETKETPAPPPKDDNNDITAKLLDTKPTDDTAAPTEDPDKARAENPAEQSAEKPAEKPAEISTDETTTTNTTTATTTKPMDEDIIVVDEKKPEADSATPTPTSTPSTTTPTPITTSSKSTPLYVPITIPVHAPPSIVNKNRYSTGNNNNNNNNTTTTTNDNDTDNNSNTDSATTEAHTIRILPKPRPERLLAIDNNTPVEEDIITETAATATVMKAPKANNKRRRKFSTKKSTKQTGDGHQYSDVDHSDMQPRKTRSRTISN